MDLLLSELRKWRHTLFSTPHIFLIFERTTISLYVPQLWGSYNILSSFPQNYFLTSDNWQAGQKNGNWKVLECRICLFFLAWGGGLQANVTKVNAFLGDNFVLDSGIFSEIILNVNHEWQSGTVRMQETGPGQWTQERGLACTSSPDVLLQDILSMLSEKTKSLSLATIYLGVKSALITIVLLYYSPT